MNNAQLSKNLSDAETAFHELLTGSRGVEFRDQNGERVAFEPADRAALERYVLDLRVQMNGTQRPHTVRFATSKGL